MAPSVNHFARLGISLGATEDEVKKAYRTMAKRWHPDKCSEAGAKEKFQEIAASYEYLSSKDRREMHERELRNPKPTPPPQPPPKQPQAKPANTFKPASTGTGTSSSSSSNKSKKKPNEASWSETFTKNYRSQQAKQGKTKERAGGPGSGARTFYFTAGGPGVGGYSFMFQDSSSNGKPSRTTSAAEEVFDELFGDFFSAMGFGAGPGGLSGGISSLGGLPGSTKNKKPRPRNVAPEVGKASGLDEEYFFTPPNPDDDPFAEKLPCPWCGQTFTRGRLAQHEEKCGKFGLSADEDEDDYSDQDGSDDFGYYSTLSTPSYSHKPHWEQQREEMMAKIRRDKQRHRDRVASQGERNSGYIKCPYCERSFSSTAAAKHIQWCKEHVRKYGVPMNPRSDKPGMSPRQDKKHDDINSETSQSGTRGKRTNDPHMARERAREYAKSVPKPSWTRKGPFDSDDDEDDDYDEDFETSSTRYGNDRKFPYTRPRMSDDFEVNGKNFGGQSQSQGHQRQGRASGSAQSDKDGTGFKFSGTGKSGAESSAFTSSKSSSTAPKRGANIKIGVKIGTGAKKPGAYASSFKPKRY